MSWIRGNGTVEVELSRLQSWVEAADPDINGRNGVISRVRTLEEAQHNYSELIPKMSAFLTRQDYVKEDKEQTAKDRDASLKRWIGIGTFIVTVIHLFGPYIRVHLGLP